MLRDGFEFVRLEWTGHVTAVDFHQGVVIDGRANDDECELRIGRLKLAHNSADQAEFRAANPDWKEANASARRVAFFRVFSVRERRPNKLDFTIWKNAPAKCASKFVHCDNLLCASDKLTPGFRDEAATSPPGAAMSACPVFFSRYGR